MSYLQGYDLTLHHQTVLGKDELNHLKSTEYFPDKNVRVLYVQLYIVQYITCTLYIELEWAVVV